jgi:hypothetical protein
MLRDKVMKYVVSVKNPSNILSTFICTRYNGRRLNERKI